MPSVKCPECGERVKLREDGKKLRCRDCGKSFYAPDDDDEDDREEEEEEEWPRRKRKPAAKKSSGVKVAAIVVGGVLTVALVALGIVLIVRGSGGSGAPTDSAKVTPDNFQRVKPGMDLAEVEGILGGSRSSSEDDMRDAFRKTGDGMKGEIAAAMEVGWARFGEGAEWRRWEGKNFRVWVAFGKTKEGNRAAFSTALEQNGSTYKRHEGFMTWAAGDFGHNLDELNADRKKEAAIRNDKKWVRGAQARALVQGEWRGEFATGCVFGADGKMTEFTLGGMPPKQGREPTYRVISDTQLETTHQPQFDLPPGPSPFPNAGKPVVRKFEYFVNQEELAMIEITPHAGGALQTLKSYYRMPARAGSAAEAKLITPLVADIRGGNAQKRQSALYRLKQFGPGAPTALPALLEVVHNSDSTTANIASDAIAAMGEVAAPAVPELIKELKAPNSGKALGVILALGRIGPAAKDALPELRELVKTVKDGQVRNEAEGLIRRLEGK